MRRSTKPCQCTVESKDWKTVVSVCYLQPTHRCNICKVKLCETCTQHHFHNIEERFSVLD